MPAPQKTTIPVWFLSAIAIVVVLAVGMEPEVTGVKLPDDIIQDSSNFIEGSKDGGMFGAGAASSPLDVNRAVQSATAASLRAIQVINKAAAVEA